MSLIKWEPFRDIERFFDGSGSFAMHRLGWDFAVDVYEDKGAIIAEMNIPGVAPEKIDVSVENGMLRVVGSREEQKETKDTNYFSKEISRGTFERIVQLPAEVEASKTEAQYREGVLKVTMPKKQASIADKIKIKVNQ